MVDHLFLKHRELCFSFESLHFFSLFPEILSNDLTIFVAVGLTNQRLREEGGVADNNQVVMVTITQNEVRESRLLSQNPPSMPLPCMSVHSTLARNKSRLYDETQK